MADQTTAPAPAPAAAPTDLVEQHGAVLEANLLAPERENERIKVALANALSDRDLWRDAAERQHAALTEIAQLKPVNSPDVDLRLAKAYAREAAERLKPLGDTPPTAI